MENCQKLASGHRSCRGCTAVPHTARYVLSQVKGPCVVSNATGCMEVTTTIYPNTSWNVPYIHSVFGNAAATISGVESAYKSLVRQDKIKENKDTKFIVFAGDGGSYDIGLQALSGALERRHNFLFVCYDNGGYMNTGNQRSSATPYGALTTTTPDGKQTDGKELFRKNLTKIVAAHDIKYVATAAVSHREDFLKKVRHALAIDGPVFINVLAPCTLGWKFPEDMGITISRLGVETNFWPLYEIKKGKYSINYQPKKRKPITEFIKHQGRFKHLFKEENKHIIPKIQKHIDSEWQKLLDITKK